MTTIKKASSMLVMISCFILSIFAFALSVKYLNQTPKSSYYGDIDSMSRGIMVVQLIFSFAILGVSIGGTIKIMGYNPSDSTPTRFVNLSLATITAMELIQFFVLLGEYNKASEYGGKTSLDVGIILSLVLMIIAAIFLALGSILPTETFGVIATGLGVFFNILAFILPINISTYAFSFLDVLLIIVYIVSLFYCFATKIEGSQPRIVYSSSQKITEQVDQPVVAEQKRPQKKNLNTSGIITSVYFYRNEKGESLSVPSQTEVTILTDNGDGTYNISYKEGSKTITVKNVNSFYIKTT